MKYRHIVPKFMEFKKEKKDLPKMFIATQMYIKELENLGADNFDLVVIEAFIDKTSGFS